MVEFRRKQDERERRREEVVGREIEAAGLLITDLLDRITEDEQLADLLRLALEAAVRTGEDAKLRMMGRAVASGALAADDAEFDEARLLLRTASDIEMPELRALLQMRENQQGTITADGVPIASRGPDVPGHLIARLQGLGVVNRPLASGALRPVAPLDTISPYGWRLLQLLQDVADSP